MTRKEFLQTKINDPKWSKTLRNRKRGKKVLKPFSMMNMKEKYDYNDIHKIGYLDIETTGLVADFDFMISYAISVRDLESKKSEIRGSYIKKSDFDYARKEKDADKIDERILNNLVEDVSDLDLWIGHWFVGKHRHDVPFIRSRCAINKISGFPKYGMVRYGDTQKWGSQIHRLHSYGLASIADAYGVSTKKTPVKTKSWKNARVFGFKKDVSYIYDHNVKDVKITDRIHRYIEEYVPIPATYC